MVMACRLADNFGQVVFVVVLDGYWVGIAIQDCHKDNLAKKIKGVNQHTLKGTIATNSCCYRQTTADPHTNINPPSWRAYKVAAALHA